MKFHSLALLLGLSFLGCNGEQPTDTSGDADTDADGDSDADADADVDDGDIDHARELEFEADGFFTMVEDDLEEEGDRDFYKLDLQPGDTVAAHAMGPDPDGGSPDTVVRVYGPDKAMIGENDDLPFRINNTDGGYVFRAETEGTHYIEVLEWSDWAGEVPAGGNGWEYTLFVTGGYSELTEGLNETVADALLNTETLYDEDEENNVYSFYTDPWTDDVILATGDDTLSPYYFTAGEIGDAGDVDTIGTRYNWMDDEDAFVPGVVSFGMFPGIATDLDATFELYDEAGELIASTDEVDVTTDYVAAAWDQAFVVPVLEVGDYYLQIKDANGAGSLHHWYAVFADVSGYNTEVVTFHDVLSGVEVSYTDATDAIMNESTNTPGAFYAYTLGRFEDGADVLDSFRLTQGVNPGNFVYVDCGTAVHGSGLRANIDLVDEDGTVLASADGQPDQADDPRILEFEIPVGVTELYLVVNRDDGNLAEGKGAYYQCYIQSDETDDSADF
jgi:hypothetical protein